jgi:hypothetical protein
MGLALGVDFIPVERALAYHNTPWMDWWSVADDPDRVKNAYYARQRIPFAEDYGGSVWFLDFDPAAAGGAGQVIAIFRDMPETVYCLAPSFDSFVKTILGEFDAGRVSAAAPDRLLFQIAEANMAWPTIMLSAQYRSRGATTAKRGLEGAWSDVANASMRNVLPPDWKDRHNDVAFVPLIKEVTVSSPEMVAEIDRLADFPALQFVTINVPGVTLAASKLSVLSGRPLYQLSLRTPSADFENFPELPELRDLTILDPRAPVTSALAKCPRLHRLTLRLPAGEPLKMLEPLRELRECALFGDGVRALTDSEVATLAGLSKLTTLSLHGVPFFDARPLAAAEQLTSLHQSTQPAAF